MEEKEEEGSDDDFGHQVVMVTTIIALCFLKMLRLMKSRMI
ncbi:hypothetical protein MTR67_051526 [Solanum verrucosum]|uniref:Uncharacterized protein n=1 Tax=Solanum verrucosum TaxID=315347 RepID=A0AAF1A079_SOLVR|nr:hypothetical protein MTR67_051526 [Solanum verrucosum]